MADGEVCSHGRCRRLHPNRCPLPDSLIVPVLPQPSVGPRLRPSLYVSSRPLGCSPGLIRSAIFIKASCSSNMAQARTLSRKKRL
ncbi:unnamed protein product [Musa acuminata var. zebrina]